MRIDLFVVAILAVWRVTHLLQAEKGPFGIFVKMRTVMGKIYLHELASCFYCFSIWVALPAAYLVGSSWMERGFLWPALSGAAILLERISDRQTVFYEEDDSDDSKEELLRQNTDEETHG